VAKHITSLFPKILQVCAQNKLAKFMSASFFGLFSWTLHFGWTFLLDLGSKLLP
jgi:hypothetical protein